MPHIFTGPATRTPVCHHGGTSQPTNMVVDVDHLCTAPIKVSPYQASLAAGGGTILWPGENASIPAVELWVVGPAQGFLSTYTIEAGEPRVRAITRDPFGVLQATATWKSRSEPSQIVPPGIWQNVSSGVIGTYAAFVRARGGLVYIGTHINPNLPPAQQPAGSGGVYPLSDGEGHLFPGNPLLWAWTDLPNVALEFVKFERGWSF